MKNTTLLIAAIAAAIVVAIVAYISLRGKTAAKTSAKPVLTTPSWNATHQPVVVVYGKDTKATDLANIRANALGALATPDELLARTSTNTQPSSSTSLSLNL